MNLARLRPPEYQFTNDWFGTTANIAQWESIFAQAKPKDCLEIGSYEGRSAVFMIEHLDSGTVTCVDTWEGGGDLSPEAMKGVEYRFDANIAAASRDGVTVRKIKKPSHEAMGEMIYREKRFDFIYIDGSHVAPDVLTDGVMAFRLLNVGGVMIFDDYLWRQGNDPLDAPSFAIDTFATMFARNMATVGIGGQRIFQRTA